MGWLAASVDGDAGCDVASELFADNALRSDEHCAGLEVGLFNGAEGLVSDEALVCLLLDAFIDLVWIEDLEGFADGELVGLARWRLRASFGGAVVEGRRGRVQSDEL